MITPRISDLLGIVNKIAPPGFAEEWDNPGLQVGDPAAAVTRIMVALDPGPAAVTEALATGCQLLLTHHPLIFKALKRISCNDPVGSLICQAIAGNLSIISLHTNYDIAEGGVNDQLATRLGLVDCQPLAITASEELVKVSVFVPQGHEEQVMTALFRFGGLVGKYRDCSFRVAGHGTFTPLAGAQPFIGAVGQREDVAELRLEVMARRNDLPALTKALVAAHPYEEPAFDLVPLLNRGAVRGLGRLAVLPAPVPLADFAARVKEQLRTAGVRLVGDPARLVRKVALCGGSGASLVREAARQGADLLVTGDVKYHEAREAEDLGVALLDAGHFATEQLMVAGLAERLGRELIERNYQAEIVGCSTEQEPFRFL
ncbi:MAG TPA: Nif3-like dinuclear metal center hexameric protein [Geobacteraceae bacterium]